MEQYIEIQKSAKCTLCTDDRPKQRLREFPSPSSNFSGGRKTPNFVELCLFSGSGLQMEQQIKTLKTFLDNYEVWPVTPPRHCPQLKDSRGINEDPPKMVDLNWAYCLPVEQPSSQKHFGGWVLDHA